MDRLARAIVDRPWLVIVATLLVAALALYSARRLEIDPSSESLFEAASAEKVFDDEAKRTFGTDEIDHVIVAASDVFTEATLEKLVRLDRKLAAVPGIERVQSLATVEVVRSVEGGIEVSPAMPEVPSGADALAALRRFTTEHPLLRTMFVNADGTALGLAITYERKSEREFLASGVHDVVDRILAEEQGPEQILVVGNPTMRAESAKLMQRDVLLFLPGTSLVLIAVLLISFRTLRGVLIPLTMVGIGLLLTVGVMAAFDVPIDVIGMILPSLLLAIGSAYTTHVVARHADETNAGGSRAEVARRTLAHLGLPIVVTAFTTAVGFASLATYRVVAIQRLGVFVTLGIILLFLLSLTFAVAVLAVLPLRKNAEASAEDWPQLRRWLDAMVQFGLRNRRAVVGFALVLLALFASQIPKLRVETNYPSYFGADSAIGRALAAADRWFGGSVGFLLVIDGPEDDSLLRAEILQRLASVQRFVQHQPGIAGASSLVDVLRLLHRGLNDDDPARAVVPDSDEAVRQLLLLVPPESIESMITPDGRRAAIAVRARFLGSKELDRAVGDIESYARRLLPGAYGVRATGSVLLANRVGDSLTTGQIQSVLLAIGVVFVAMSALFTSVRLGLVAMLPNLLPIVVYFGLLGALDVPLGLTTALIASIALGLGVDEAIHLLAEFNHRLRQHGDQDRAIHEAMATVGPPVVFTTLALGLGFLVPVMSSLVPIQQFAIFASLNVFASLIADLCFLPAFVASVRFVTLWDLLGAKLGHAPHETIPLFHGLRRSQARVAALMGHLQKIEAGEPILVRGAVGDSLLIVISGRAEVSVPSDAGRVRLRDLGRGEVIGEMGLLRHHARTADVLALEPTEVLVCDQRFLDVLGRRYPRIAAVVFLNLARILSDRLEGTTEQLRSVAFPLPRNPVAPAA